MALFDCLHPSLLLSGTASPSLLVAGPRFELGTEGYEPSMLPLHYPAALYYTTDPLKDARK